MTQLFAKILFDVVFGNRKRETDENDPMFARQDVLDCVAVSLVFKVELGAVAFVHSNEMVSLVHFDRDSKALRPKVKFELFFGQGIHKPGQASLDKGLSKDAKQRLLDGLLQL